MIIFLQHLNVKPVEETKAFMTFVIPHDKENLLTVSIDTTLSYREKLLSTVELSITLLSLTITTEIFR